MKIVAFAAAAVVAASLPALAQNTADSSGCGLGTTLFEGQQGVGPQVLAVTTNGTSGNGTFGITFGTLGCNSDGIVASPAKVRMIAVSSLDSLSAEIAQGEGETLEAIAVVYGVGEADRAHFNAAMKENFDVVFPSANASAEDVVSGMLAVMSADPILAKYVVEA